MKPNGSPMLPMSPKSFSEEPLLVWVGALVLCSSAAQSVHEAAREVTGGSEREERVTLLALLLSGACTKTVSIRCGNQ
jgi:hypothetical protein